MTAVAPGRRTWRRGFAAFAAALAVFAVLLVGLIATGWLSLDAQRLREPVAAALARALGRDVEIAGSARLALSFRPTLVVRDVRIANPAGFSASEFATIAELRLDTELLPLLRQRLIVGDLRGRGIVVRLARSAAGRGNWIFEPAADVEERPRFQTDWRRVVAEQAVVEYAAAGAPRRWQLDSVVLEGLTGLPLHLSVQAKAGPQLDVQGEASSAPLAELAGPEPWPFAARLTSPQSKASISGARQATPAGAALRLRVEASTTDLDEIGMLLGVTLPVDGAAALAGELEFAPGLLVLRDLDGRFGGVELAGEITVDGRGPRPRVSGRLAVPEVDVWNEAAAEPGDAASTPTLAAVYGVLRDAELHFARLAQVDADLEVAIGSLVDSPGDVREVSARLQVDAGRLSVPFTATIGGAAIEGALSADTTAGEPGFGLRLAARDAPAGGLALLLFDLPYIAGTVHLFAADFSASGRTLAELIRDLEGRVGIEDARLSYGNYAGARPVDLHLAAAELAQPRGGTIAATVRGSLRGKAFEGYLGADTVERVLRERRTPFQFAGSSAGVRLRLAGVLAEPGADSGPDIEVELSAPQARELAPWLGFSSQSADPVALSGRVRVRENGVKLGAGSLVFGRSSIKGELDWQRAGGKTRVEASLAAELLAPAELRGLRDAPAPGRRTLVDLPILPETLDFGDADLELTVQGVHGLALDLTDLAFSGRLRDGALEPSPFSLRLQGNPLAGTLALDTRGAAPAASLSLEGEDFDAGAVLRRWRLAQDIDARIGQLRLQAAVRGSQLGEAVEQSSFQASFESGTLSYRDTGAQATLNLVLAGGELRAEAGGPVTGSISGTAGDAPIRLDLQGGPLGGLFAPDGRWPFALTAALPDAQWVISGSAAPGRAPATELSLTLSGRRLSDLDVLLATALPPWGPYAVTGTLRFGPDSYEVEDARVAIGESVLLGSGSLDTGRRPPRLEGNLVAPNLQLDDFPLGAWSPLPAPAGRMSARAAGRAFSGGVAAVHPLLSRERLGLADAQVAVRVERLLAGADELGSAGVAASVVNGAATLGPIEIDGPAGRASLAIGYEPREHDAEFSARALVDRLDYGLVAALVDPAAGIDGAFSLDLAVDAVTPELNRLMETASGHVDLAVWPERVRWGGFDLWAGNLLRSLLPFFSRTASHINCVIGHFDLEQGALSSQALIVDTTNTRALGWAEADFATERLHLRFVPRHKQPRLFSLAIPVEVRGTFSDYRIALRPADALGRVAQWFKSLVMVPLSWFGVGRLPSDGHDVCAEPARR